LITRRNICAEACCNNTTKKAVTCPAFCCPFKIQPLAKSGGPHTCHTPGIHDALVSLSRIPGKEQDETFSNYRVSAADYGGL
jgi:hypothetical protein